jgi:lysophospholipase L1-like esterase
MATMLKDREKILFIGDSITDCGRRDTHRPLGCGYVQLFADMLSVREPEKKITIINTGIGGNTAEDLRSRWFDDALSYRPDWLSIKIGINDCHRWVTNSPELQSPAKFAEIYDEILGLTVKKLPRTKILLIDPFYAGLDEGNDMTGSYRGKVFKVFPEYLKTVGKMSRKYNTLHVLTHAIFLEHFKFRHPTVFFPNEPVHPNSAGHLLIAEAVFKTLSKD